MPESLRIIVKEVSQTAEARRVARHEARKAGMDDVLAERVAIVATEACTNLLKHAGGGEVLVHTIADGDPEAPLGLEFLALDQGPGMADLERCMRDGFSTGGSPGQGLGAIRRLSTSCDIYAPFGHGTALLARWPAGGILQDPVRWHPPLSVRVGAVNVSKPGQEVCGDSWGMVSNKDGCTILVADGLGHGPEAKRASAQAVRMLHQHPELGPAELIERVHLALRSTRGAAVAVARLSLSRGLITFAGAGNIAAQVSTSGRPVQHMVSVNGTAGMQMQKLREFSYPWFPDGLLILHSDGLSTSTGLDRQNGLALRDPSLIAGVLYRDFARHSDDATVIVAKAA